MLKPTTPLEESLGHPVVATEPQKGPTLLLGSWPLFWKAEGKDTGYSFSIFETQIEPGKGLPLHKHPYAEFFYVLEGSLDFSCWNEEGETVWVHQSAGGTVVAPPQIPHGFQNKGDMPARILGVSTYHHERMLKDAVHPNGKMNFLPAELSGEDFERLFRSMEENQVYVVADHA